MDLAGQYRVRLESAELYVAALPGTLDENGIGEQETKAEKWHPDAALEEEGQDTGRAGSQITTRFTRKHAYEGTVYFEREFFYEKKPAVRVFLEAERCRKLQLFLNKGEIPVYCEGTLSTPYVFEVTDALTDKNQLALISDNAYRGWPEKAIKYSSAATNETQTNWNGILGYLRLREERENFISSLRVYPTASGLDVRIEVDALRAGTESMMISSEALEKSKRLTVKLEQGKNVVSCQGLACKKDIKMWDEYEGYTYQLSVSGEELEEKTAEFGIRIFSDDGCGHLALNGHRIFLRSESNCCVFADTGHMPMAEEEWLEKLTLYRDYGVNCIRFHSHCPPDAAFRAADRLGMLMQVELSNWDPQEAFEAERAFSYYRLELQQILHWYANHPSFVMLTLGNELQCNEQGRERMNALVRQVKEWDPTRMYAGASNGFYGMRGADEASDFYTSSNYYTEMIRGTSSGMEGYINHQYPSAEQNYNQALEVLRKDYHKPVFSFEVGQYEVLPDFREIEEFKGVLLPDNLAAVKDQVEQAGMLSDWERRVQVSGALSRIAYREEIEAAMRTPELSGISLLGLQDFPGQGTALVGMINAHFRPKPYAFARPEEFRKFFAPVLPLVQLPKYTYYIGEVLEAEVLLANYGKTEITGTLNCRLLSDGTSVSEWEGEPTRCPHSGLHSVGTIRIPLDCVKQNSQLTLQAEIAGFVNEYPIWIYTTHKPSADGITIVQTLQEAWEPLAAGENVFLSVKPHREAYQNAVKTSFTTDFWSVGTFPQQEGYMGCLPDPRHPVFQNFPTADHPDWQWWALTSTCQNASSYAMILPRHVTPLLEAMDSYARLRRLALLFECRVGQGKLLVSSMGLLEKTNYPEVNAMLDSIYTYMCSEAFYPQQILDQSILQKIITF